MLSRWVHTIVALLAGLWASSAYGQVGPGPVPYRGVNNWNLIFGTDNTYDIGASGATRPRTGYFGTSVVTPALTVSGLTSGRVPFASTGGLLADDADLTFSGGNTLNATALVAGNVTNSALTSGRVTFASTAGLLADNSALTWDGTILSATRFQAAAGSSSLASFRMTVTNTGFAEVNSTNWGWYVAGTERVRLGSGGQIGTTGGISLGSSISAPDVQLLRAAAGVMSMGNGTSIRGFLGGGTAASSATALAVPAAAVYHVTGTTNITSITSTNIGTGTCITLIFDGVLTFTDGSNLKLAGDFVTTADDTIGVCYDGTNWYETHRSVN